MDEVVTDQAVVEIPFGLVPGFSASDDLLITERETVLVRGARVTDPEALDTMRLPAGEDAVEVASTLLPVSTEER